jgi:hypothetical protein
VRFGDSELGWILIDDIFIFGCKINIMCSSIVYDRYV